MHIYDVQVIRSIPLLTPKSVGFLLSHIIEPKSYKPLIKSVKYNI